MQFLLFLLCRAAPKHQKTKKCQTDKEVLIIEFQYFIFRRLNLIRAKIFYIADILRNKDIN